MHTAKVFNTGMSQAVRLPKAFRFDVDEVFISKENGRVILTPKKSAWDDFFKNAEKFPDDFLSERPDNILAQSREDFEDL